MGKRDDILDSAEAAFSARGFHAVPVDAIIADAGVSPRTLYSHFPSKTDLAVAVLERRHTRFLDGLAARAAETEDPFTGLFDGLEDWLTATGGSGCLFLRALGEFDDSAVEKEVTRYRSALTDLVAGIADRRGDRSTVAPILVLIEGATALAPTLGAGRAVTAARVSAAALCERTKP